MWYESQQKQLYEKFKWSFTLHSYIFTFVNKFCLFGHLVKFVLIFGEEIGCSVFNFDKNATSHHPFTKGPQWLVTTSIFLYNLIVVDWQTYFRHHCEVVGSVSALNIVTELLLSKRYKEHYTTLMPWIFIKLLPFWHIKVVFYLRMGLLPNLHWQAVW